MSQENVELLRRAIDAYNERDGEASLASWDAGIEGLVASEDISGVYRGERSCRSGSSSRCSLGQSDSIDWSMRRQLSCCSNCTSRAGRLEINARRPLGLRKGRIVR